MLYGRETEAARLRRLLDTARSGHGGALVVRGQAGIGKSALVAEVAETPAFRVLRALGVETEAALPYAGLHALLGQETDRFDALPAPQADALRRALGLTSGNGHDHIPVDAARPAGTIGPADTTGLVGLAVLTLLADLAEETPVLCVVDDAHWLDRSSAEALLFAARRLHAERVAVLLVAREGDAPEFSSPGLPELPVAGLADDAATELLRRHRPHLDAPAREAVLRDAHGNPLALLELSRSATVPGSGAERATVPDEGSPRGPSPVQRALAARVADLAEPARSVLLVAAVIVRCSPNAWMRVDATRVASGLASAGHQTRERSPTLASIS